MFHYSYTNNPHGTYQQLVDTLLQQPSLWQTLVDATGSIKHATLIPTGYTIDGDRLM